MSPPAIIEFGIGLDGSVDQLDDLRATRDIMLRWFLPNLDFPLLGFDVHRAAIPDIPPLPFDDINVTAVSSKPSWEYAGFVTLSCPSGPTVKPSAGMGWNRLVIAPNAPVHIRFSGTAWRIQVRAETIGVGIEMVALVAGAAWAGVGVLWKPSCADGQAWLRVGAKVIGVGIVPACAYNGGDNVASIGCVAAAPFIASLVLKSIPSRPTAQERPT